MGNKHSTGVKKFKLRRANTTSGGPLSIDTRHKVGNRSSTLSTASSNATADNEPSSLPGSSRGPSSFVNSSVVSSRSVGSFPSLASTLSITSYDDISPAMRALDSSPQTEFDSTSSLLSNESVLSPTAEAMTNLAKLQRNGMVHNSCWTLYVDSTVTKPDIEVTLKCVAHVVLREIEKNIQHNRRHTMDLFEEVMPVVMPEEEEIFVYLQKLFQAVQLSADSAIIMLVYMHRMLGKTNIAVQARNWKRIILGGVLMASKVWDDLAVWNIDFCSILPMVSNEEMNHLERFYLTAMDFNVNVKPSLFTKCYFVLRELAQENKNVFSQQPLSAEDAKRLQAHMRAFAQDIRTKYGEAAPPVGSPKDSPAKDPLEGEGGFPLRRVKSDNMFVHQRVQTAHVF